MIPQSDDALALLAGVFAVRVVELLKPILAASTLVVQPRLLTVEQAAVYLGRTPNAVRILLTRGILPAVKADGRTMLDIRDLDRWIEQNRVVAHGSI